METLVLIIHPGVMDTALLKQALEAHEGVMCRDFTDERAALNWLARETEPLAAIFVGDMSEEGLETVLSSPRALGVPVYRLVNEREEKLRRALQSLGQVIDNILVKPFRPALLLERIQQCLRISPIKNPSGIFLDDSRDDSELIRECLAKCGLVGIHSPADSAELIETVKRKSDEVALIVCDWELPSVETLEALRGTRQTPKFLSLPFVIVSSQDTLEEVKRVQSQERRFHGSLVCGLDYPTLSVAIEPLVERIARQITLSAYLSEVALFRSRGQFEHAFNCLSQAVKRVPGAAALYTMVGDLLSSPECPGDREECRQKAASAYELAWRANRFDLECLTKAVDALSAVGRHEEVIRMLKVYLDRFAFDEAERTRLAKAFLHVGDYGAAAVELKRVLSLAPSNAEALALVQVLSSFHVKTVKPAA